MLKISINDNIELINKLKDKITKYRDEFSKSEALVRYALIDPFLRSLGWDTEDPSVVKPEYSTEAGRPDYALFIEGETKPIAFVGAKKLGKYEDLNQHISYCVSEGVRYFIATDGQKWELYETFKAVPTPEKKISGWDIVNDDPSKIAVASLTIANTDAFGSEPVIPRLSSNDYTVKESITDASPVSKREDAYTEVEKISKGISQSKRKRIKPRLLIIKGQTLPVKNVKDVLVQTANWLLKKGYIRNAIIPLETGPKRYLLNSKPEHKDGQKFRAPVTLKEGLYLETHEGHIALTKYAFLLMKKCGLNDEDLTIEWEEI
ncbi:MAG: hypothetical protein QW292_07020 [Candidatus Parvarchaeota archaeon]